MEKFNVCVCDMGSILTSCHQHHDKALGEKNVSQFTASGSELLVILNKTCGIRDLKRRIQGTMEVVGSMDIRCESI